MYNLYCCIVILLFLSYPLLSQDAERLGGSVFYENIRDMPFEEREQAILEQFEQYNLPEILLQFIRIDTVLADAHGNQKEVVFFVSPDYLSIGTKEDYFIIPMGPITAQKVADQFEASLPTPKIVDIVYERAILKLEPFSFVPRGNRNETPDILYEHSKIIQAQIAAAGYKPGVFVAGTKKDIVISSKLVDTARSRHVSIYGWHKPDGKPIQPLSNIHINTYVDYSHGARLISNRVLIDGVKHDYREILQDSVLHTLLSNEREPLRKTTY